MKYISLSVPVRLFYRNLHKFAIKDKKVPTQSRTFWNSNCLCLIFLWRGISWSKQLRSAPVWPFKWHKDIERCYKDKKTPRISSQYLLRKSNLIFNSPLSFTFFLGEDFLKFSQHDLLTFRERAAHFKIPAFFHLVFVISYFKVTIF